MDNGDSGGPHTGAIAVRDDIRTGKRAQAVERTIREGSYWRYDASEPLGEGFGKGVLADPGEVLLLTEVKMHEGEVHSVQLQVHPRRRRKGSNTRFMLRTHELVAQWTEVEGGPIRAREIARIERRIADEETALDRLARTSATELLPWDGPAENASAALVAQGNAHSQAISRHHEMKLAADRISEAVISLIPYTEERMEAVRARHQGAVEEVEKASEGLHILGLYAGESVHIEHWKKGPRAHPDEPLIVYQRTRYIDEESLYNTLKGDGQGADIRNLATYMHALAENATVRARVCPAPRCVVAIQPRRHSRNYDDPWDILRFSKENRSTFLLVRNGESFTTLHYEMGERNYLVPHRNAWRELFREDRGWGRFRFHGEGDEPDDEHWIGIDDVRFVDTHKRASAEMRRYLAAWVVLAGAHLRLQLFAPLAAEERLARPLNLMRAREHDEIVHIVRDEEDALDAGRIPFEHFRKARNAEAHPGGRVVAIVARAITDEHQRDWYDQRRSNAWSDKERRPIEGPEQDTPIVTRVRQRLGELVIDVKARSGRTRAVQLTERARWWLWIEGVPVDTLQRYLDHDREHYRDIAPLVIPAIDALTPEQDGHDGAAAKAAMLLGAIGELGDAAHIGPIAAMLANEESWRTYAETIAGAQWLEMALAQGPKIAVHTPYDGPEPAPGGLRWTLRTTVEIKPDGTPGRSGNAWAGARAMRIETPVWRRETGDEARAWADGRRRRATFAGTCALEREITTAGTAVRQWLKTLREKRSDIDWLQSGAVNLARASRGRITTTMHVLRPVAVVRRTNAKVEEHEVGALCVRTCAFEVLQSCGTEYAEAALQAGLAMLYRRPHLKERTVRENVARGARAFGQWIVVMNAKRLKTDASGRPWLRDDEDAAWWTYLCPRSRLRRTSNGTLKVESEGARAFFAREGDKMEKKLLETGWQIVSWADAERGEREVEAIGEGK